jgi:ferrochelatase
MKRPEIGILLVNLGSPEKPEASAVKPYLREFLSDRRVIEMSPWLWQPILRLFVLTRRPERSAAKYRKVWLAEGSPLVVHTRNLAEALQKDMDGAGKSVFVDWAMRYGAPSVEEKIRSMQAQGIGKILIVPMYPQYSATTTATVNDAVCRTMLKLRNQPEVRFLRDYHSHPAYIRALAQSVRNHWEKAGEPGADGRLFLSFHGMPAAYSEAGDPYKEECRETLELLAGELGIPRERVLSGFQSRFGKAEWIQPYTAEEVVKAAKSGVKRLDVLCPGFSADCLETLEEIAMDVAGDFRDAGGQSYHYIPALNAQDFWVRALSEILQPHLSNW